MKDNIKRSHRMYFLNSNIHTKACLRLQIYYTSNTTSICKVGNYKLNIVLFSFVSTSNFCLV